MTDMLRTDWAAKFGLRTVSCAVVGGLLGAALLTAGTPARAGDDDEAFDTKILRSVLEGIGLRRDGEGLINYEERAPLVIPPTRALPPPERSDSVIANNPAWPKDPDVRRRKEEAALAAKQTMTAEEQILHDESRLSPSQMTPGAKPNTAARKTSTPDPSTGTSWGYGEKMSPKQLGFTGSLWGMMFGKDKKKESEDTANFTKEPPRTALTEPPAGYQTPSPEQPYGLGKQKPVVPTSSDYMINNPTGEGRQ